MKNKQLKIQNILTIFFFLLFIFCSSDVYSQSINQDHPTPIATNEISGNIAARDVGDARLTTFFYALSGTQGDVFINVLTKNLNGSIDIFTTENLRPLTKLTIYANDSEIETGRVVYLRKPEKLILRIEGRSPNDDAATYRIKFAGSFQPLEATAEIEVAPEVKIDNQTNIRVNSVGTILEIKPTVKESIVAEEKSKDKTEATAENKEETKKFKTKKQIEITEESQVNDDSKVVLNEDARQESVKAESAPTAVKKEQLNKTKVSTSPAGQRSENAVAEASSTAELPLKKAKKEKVIEPNPLENIKLIVVFKDGNKIEYPMSEVIKVGVDKGVLTINSKIGGNARYSILAVAKMTIE